MGLGLRSKNRKSPSVPVDYQIHVQEIKPWPPSQSLKSLRSVLLQWENGKHNAGSTDAVSPLLGSGIGDGKIEFDESFMISLTLLRDFSAKSGDPEAFQKNHLEFNLYEPRRGKTIKGQALGTAMLDLADYGIIKECLSISIPINCKRSFSNTSQPNLFISIQPVNKGQTSSSPGAPLHKEASLDNKSIHSVSALINKIYAEEAELASFTDDDSSSHSSLTIASSNRGSPPHFKEHEDLCVEIPNARSEIGSNAQEIEKSMSKTLAKESFPNKNVQVGGLEITNSSPSGVNGESVGYASIEKESGMEEVTSSDNVRHDYKENREETEQEFGQESCSLNGKFQSIEEPLHKLSEDAARKHVSPGRNTSSAERFKHVKSVRVPLELAKSNGSVSCNQVTDEGKELGAQNGERNLASNQRKHAKIHLEDFKSSNSNSKIQQLEHRIAMLEEELREAAAVEVALYSVVAEHGSSMAKVHAPARRLSRLYLHATEKTSRARRANAAKNAVSGLVLAAKACGNDVPRLTFWLSNSVMLRLIITQAIGSQQLETFAKAKTDKNSGGKDKNKSQSLRWKESSPSKKENMRNMHETLGDWEDPHTFKSAIEKIEAWIFSRVIESIWWQNLAPYMQSATAKEIGRGVRLDSRKSYGRISSSADLEQGDISIELWKKAFSDSCERLCPVRAGGHECGCLPVLSRLIMEQCVARLDVAMFNAILRETSDDIPTDPVSDPISDLKVLPIPAGKSSFSAGAQLKNAIGNWSRWLTDLFGIDEDESLEGGSECGNDNKNERQDTSFKPFHLLNALSDLMMLPKDMLLNKSTREEVCPTFGAPLIKRVLENFVPDEFCPETIPVVLLDVLESEDSSVEIGKELVTSFPCNAAPAAYLPPGLSTLAAGVLGEIECRTPLRRSGSSVLRKSYTSDDELDELESPFSSIIVDGSQSSPTPNPRLTYDELSSQNSIRYQLLREIWLNSN